MKRRKAFSIHGIISIALFLTAFGIGVGSVFSYSFVVAIVYLLLIMLAFVVVAVVYCSKCMCREHCNHFIIGRLSSLLSKKNDAPYNLSDMVIGLTPMLAAIVFPQFWLVQNRLLLLLFWLPLVVGGMEAYFLVCNQCRNYRCKMCRNKIIILKP